MRSPISPRRWAIDRRVLLGHSLGRYLSLALAMTPARRGEGPGAVGHGPGFRDPNAREQWNDYISTATVAGAEAGIGLQPDALVIAASARSRSPSSSSSASVMRAVTRGWPTWTRSSGPKW